MTRGLLVLFGVATMIGAVACAEALRLEPEGSGGPGSGGMTSSSTMSAGGSGGMAPVPCVSNADCPAPTAICDSVQGLCVECLEIQHCAHMPGTVCDTGLCRCETEGETWCEPNICADTMTDPDHCGQCDFECFGSCAMGVCADDWVPVSSDGAPSARGGHVAVWTGSEMFIWGGSANNSAGLSSGGLYDPATREWRSTTVVNAPSPRMLATAVWTGTQVIVWGGINSGNYLGDGAAYDPATDQWTAINNAGSPAPRNRHTAVWTGDQMVIWGGADDSTIFGNGNRYSPMTDLWTPTANIPNPSETRRNHTAVWDTVGMRMVVYGGFGFGTTMNTQFPGDSVIGGRYYNPTMNNWVDINMTNQPRKPRVALGGVRRLAHVDLRRLQQRHGTSRQWRAPRNGYLGGASPAVPPPSARREHTAVWLATAGVMVVFGGRDDMSNALATGGVLNPTLTTWDKMTSTVLGARYRHTAVSTDDTMIVWGGFTGNSPYGDGAVYTP